MKTSGVLVLMLSGCATTEATSGATLRRNFLNFESEAPSANRWHTIETDSFVFITDLPPDQAKQGAQFVAQSLTAVSAMFGRAPIIDTHKIEVIALASDMEFERTFGTRVLGVTRDGPEGSTVFLYGAPHRWFDRVRNDVRGTTSPLQHELAHAVLNRYFPKQQTWFAEGMACFLETAEWLDDQTVRLGEINVGAYTAYRKIRSLTVKGMLAWNSYTGGDLATIGYYGLSWLFIHWAFDHQLQLLAKYFFLLSKGDPLVAWDQTFGTLHIDFDATLNRYSQAGAYTRPPSKVALHDPIPVSYAPTDEKRAAELEAFLKLGAKLQ